MKRKPFLIATTLATILLAAQRPKAQNTSPFWSLAGNSNATTTSKLGTTNSINLRLFTNNAERVRILGSNGFVGVGTVSPTERLHVNSAAGANPFRVQVAGNTKLLVHSGGGVSIGGNLNPPTNGLYVSGNVGIGTASPAAKLHVAGTSRFTANVTIANGGLNVTHTTGIGLVAYAPTTAIYASTEGYENTDIGVYGEGYGYGVKGSGYYYGVYGGGNTGVHGSGDNYGLYGTANYTGVYGRGGLGFGVYGISAQTGVYGAGDDYGVRGYSNYGYGGDFHSTSGYGLSVSTTSGTYAGAFYGTVYASGGYITSDKNVKEGVEEFGGALDIINQLKPRRYTFKGDEKYRFLNLPKGNHFGLLAQDVEQVLPNLVSTGTHRLNAPQPAKPDTSGKAASVTQKAETAKETINLKAVNYIELIPVLIKGMQEQQRQIEELKTLVSKLSGERGGNFVTGALGQNTPNPAKSSTRISYKLPAGTGRAQLVLTDAEGKTLKALSLTESGYVDLNTAGLSSGLYNYSFVADGKVVETKRLTVVR
jgi:hypothetical protein